MTARVSSPQLEHSRRCEEAGAAGRLVRTLAAAGFGPVRVVMEYGGMLVFVSPSAIDELPGTVWADAVSHGVQIVS